MRLGLSLVLCTWAAAGGAHALQPDAQFAATLRAALNPSVPAAAPAVHVPIADASSPGGLTWFSNIAITGPEPSTRLDLATMAKRVTPGAVLGPQTTDDLQTRGYDFSITQGWPSAFSFAAGKYNFDVSPHASFGLGEYGRSAEAGAMVRFGKNLEDSVTRRLNIKDGSTFGVQARWYVFAAASGRAVGMNMTNTEGDWRRMGLSQDNANAIIGDTQAGVGWRRGPMAATLGYIRRDVKIRQGLEGLMGAGDRPDNVVALAFTIKPQQ